MALDFTRAAFEGFPSEQTRRHVIEAEVELEDAEAVAAEFIA